MLTPEQRDRRRRIMGRSQALGHCVCDPRKPCPCPVFRERQVCECAGERLPAPPSGQIRLTEHVRSPGCASKIGKKELREALAGLPGIDDPRVLVGSADGDDAGVIRLGTEGADDLILTVDVFAPSVDDPYTFGQIAAANSVSDIYAMGGTPLTALSIIGFPIHELPGKVMREILRGGIEKMREAGIAVIGGHSINDAEIKCGFAVVGTAPRDTWCRNAGARPGDVLVLTKPLGVGIVAFAAQIGRATPEQSAAIAESMATLNRPAAERMRRHRPHAVTDVTGFSLVGHLAEIVANSAVAVELDFDAIPLFPGVAELARQDILPGAVERNREAASADMLDFAALAPAQENILFCPETSGGLLVCLPEKAATTYLRELRKAGVATAAIIGRVTGKAPGGRISARTRRRAAFRALKPKPLPDQEENMKKASAAPTLAAPSCCASPADVAAASATREPLPAAADAFQAYMAAVNAPGAIDLKHKKLIALALSVVTKCEPCVKINTQAAREAGANDAEIAEAVALGIAFGGAPTAMFYNQTRQR
jgi:selenide,water dikinase